MGVQPTIRGFVARRQRVKVVIGRADTLSGTRS